MRAALILVGGPLAATRAGHTSCASPLGRATPRHNREQGESSAAWVWRRQKCTHPHPPPAHAEHVLVVLFRALVCAYEPLLRMQ